MQKASAVENNNGLKKKEIVLTTGQSVVMWEITYGDVLDLLIAAEKAGERGSAAYVKEYELQLICKSSGLSVQQVMSMNITDGTLLDTVANALNVPDRNFLAQSGQSRRTMRQTGTPSESSSTGDISSQEGLRGKR